MRRRALWSMALIALGIGQIVIAVQDDLDVWELALGIGALVLGLLELSPLGRRPPRPPVSGWRDHTLRYFGLK